MASYTTNDLFPEGGNYKAGDTCDSVDPNAVVPSWIYTGLQWVPNSVNSKVDPVTGGIKTIAVLTQAQYDALPVKDPNTEYNIVAA